MSIIDTRRDQMFPEVRRPVRHLFSFIGSTPNTGWLSGSDIALDPKGYVLTYGDLASNPRSLETSIKGVFAVGDVRSGSVKRVAAAAGEDAQVVATLHRVLGQAAFKLCGSKRSQGGKL